MKEITKCEEQILLIIYRTNESLKLAAINQAVNRKFGHEWKSQTVSTFLSRLVNKGYLLANKEGRYTHYQPTIPFEQYQKKKLEETCKMLFDGDAELFRKMAQTI